MTTMTGQQYYCKIWLLIVVVWFSSRSVLSLPMQLSILHREKECLFEYVERDESITFAVIVLSGSELKASITFDGPMVEEEDVSAKEIWETSESYRYDPAKKDHLIVFGSMVDFEHLNPIKNKEVREDEEEEVADENESIAEKRARRARDRKRALEKRQQEQEDLMNQRKHVREEGDPFQKTYKAKANGWYRFCVTASWHAVDVEVDLRREKELGGVGPNGHVYTLEEKTLAEEENYMEEDTAEKEGIKDEDFKATREKLKSLRRLLADISNRQQKERHRIQLHSATNEHSHSRMVLSSIFQTFLFCAVTGYQVFTIRRWFKGAPVLG